ncbi:MAG TPA: type I polyketide synthase [Thermoanaerobaculia bacterium]|nr:type I polyketide synthase [Thermoanaerobaculia bacterium]
MPRPLQPIAIVGMAGQFPQARNVDEFWQNLAQGRNCITEVPRQRWDANAYYQPGDAAAGKTNSQWFGALDEYDRFDPLFFNISPTEAELMDPQQRVFMQTCWQSIENAGYDARGLSGSKCGVYVGCAAGDYQQLSRQHQLSAQGFTGNAMSILAARISYFLNLQGPCVSIDTACSSSLVAIAQACDSLNSGGSDLVLAGGVYVMAGPDMHIRTAQAGMLSPEGKCFTFDERADGFVPGEGVGVVVLKRLADAQKDRDIIHGVIEGWSVNQDGKTNGITAPNPESQTRLMQEVYDKYQIDPANIQLIEAHGTGTKLGDPIEVEGLKASFEKYTGKKGYCALGSVKSNIGHCLTAAGIAGVIKLLLALKHRQLPPTINFERLNERIDLNDSPFYVNNRLQEWKVDGAARRLTAVSSFGFSGTNAHLVIGEYLPAAEQALVPVATPNTKTVIPLSARTEEQLKQRARDLLSFIRQDAQSSGLMEIAYTLQVGRAAMDERLGFVVSSVGQLAEKLQAWIDGEQGIEEAYQGQAKRSRESLILISRNDEIKNTLVGGWIAQKNLSALLDLWVKGLDFDWNWLYGEDKPRRVSLPTYPFAKERYWIETATNGKEATPRGAMAVLHPLLHRNTSDLSEQRYSSTFTGDETFLADYQIKANGQGAHRVLPGVAYLEMARAAIEQASPARSESAVMELHDIVWALPIVVDESRRVSIALSANDNGRIDFEIYSQDSDRETVHCHGRAVISYEPAPAALDLEQLKAQMEEGRQAPDGVYAVWSRMGLDYGPTYRGVTAVYCGSGQLLAQLRLPNVVVDGWRDYVLHPSLMEGASQATVGLTSAGSESSRPRLASALKSLRIISPCTSEMLAWARFAQGGEADAVVRLDVDLCDERGNVCVQMRGLSLCEMSEEIGAAVTPMPAIGSLFATPVWRASEVDASAGLSGIEFAEHHIVLCELSEVEVDQLQSLLPQSQCLLLQGTGDTIAKRYSDFAVACFEGFQRILERKALSRVLLQIVVADHEEGALFAGLSALLKTAALENPQFIGQLIQVPAQTTAEELAGQLQAEKPGSLEPSARYEQGGRQILRWRERLVDLNAPPIAFKDHGVYLITGGLGGLGLLFAKEILEHTRETQVVLTGRSAVSREKQALLDALPAQSGRVTYRSLDLGDPDQVEQLIATIIDEHGQLNGILHAAGLLADNLIRKKTSDEFRDVLAPKVTGTFNLDQASRNVELDFFVLFSSIAGVLGNPGQADYATASGFMDQFAAYRNRQVSAGQRHGRTRSINWPLWQAGGMSLDAPSQELILQTAGIRPMRTSTGLQAFYRSLALPYDQMLVVEGIQPKIKAFLQKTRIFDRSAIAEAAASLPYAPAETEGAISPVELQQQLKFLMGELLRIDISVIDVDQPFVELGLDSFLGAELVVAINRRWGTELSHIKLFDYSTVRAFSLLLEQEIRNVPGYDVQAPEAAAVRSLVPAAGPQLGIRKRDRVGRTGTSRQMGDDHRIAIIGMSGRYPQAGGLGQFWDNLVEGRNSITEVPASRWDVHRYYDPDRTKSGTTYSKWLGALDDVDCFDPLFFRISPQEAEYMDPQHRLFLQESYKAFEDSGYSSNTLSNTKCGVYLGISTSDYLSLISRNGVQSAPVTSNSYSIAAARIAYHLNLKGPAIAVDTACSSALVAIHLAAQALMSREIDMALAGGVSLWLTPESYVAMSQAGMFSAEGQCKTFDEGADGIVNGEGVGAVVLKRLKDAQADNDFIYGVILGSGINQDGKTNGITAPSVNSQIELERSIYARFDIAPETVSYVETHGTGTRLGDPIELEALATVFKEKTAKKNFCALGSVKSNIGHTTAAAGVAGLQKVLLSMRHRMLVPTLNVVRENSRFDFTNSPFYISRQKQSWDVTPGSLRRAAVSSFGFSGTNAHLVVEEYSMEARPAVPSIGDTKFIVPLSARTEEQLWQRSRDLLEFIRTVQPVDLADVAWTLQVGRDAMEERLGFIVSSIDQLADVLTAYISGQKNIEGIRQGRVEPGNDGMTMIGRDDDMQEAIDKWIARRKLSKLLDLWIRGLQFDWNKLYGGVKPRRIPLPTYPFAREHYWIEDTTSSCSLESRFVSAEDMRSIEDIIDEIDDETTDTEQAVRALKMLV